MRKQVVGKLILVGFVVGAIIAPYGSVFAQQGEILEKAVCSELLPPFSVTAEISPEMDRALAGVQMRFFVTVKNEKRGKDIAQITRLNTFDTDTYDIVLKRFAGSVSAKDHPEWATKQKVIKWVNDSRKNSERFT